MADDDEAQLLAAIAADPEDAQAREVCADWLDKRADPRGEYVRLELLLHTIPVRLAELAATLDPAWLARVARHYDVILLDGGIHKIGCIKVVRELSGLGLKDAKDIVDRVARGPQLVVADLDRDVALRMVEQLRAAGAKARAIPHGMPAVAAKAVALPPGVKVMLVSVVPAQRLAAVTLVREVCGSGIRDAYRLVARVIDGTPGMLFANATVEVAGDVVQRFASVGVVQCTPK